MVFKQATSKYWWFKFVWNGELIRESTKQTNRRVAGTMESARRTQLAKGEVGIRELKLAPTLAEFYKATFQPFIEREFAEKPKTLAFYEYTASTLLAHAPLARARLDQITADMVGGLITKLQGRKLSVVTVNRTLHCLRRMLKLAVEWKVIRAAEYAVKMLPGEKRNERVLSADEETKYLKAAREVGDGILAEYRKALAGIRATQRDEKPVEPEDPYLLSDVVSILIECALRPEEVHRLRWEEIRDGFICIAYGKTAASRRMIPMTEKSQAIIEGRRQAALSPDWVFPAPTASGHVEQSTLKGRHTAACTAAGVPHFPFYTFRHTALTRWASHMDPFTLAYLAGHASYSTTKRYVHPQAETILAAMKKAREAQGGHTTSHTDEK